MTTRHDESTVEEILYRFQMENEVPTRDVIQAWMTQYPQFAREIEDYAAEWVLSECTALLPPTLDEEHIRARVQSIAGNVLQQLHQEHGPTHPPPFQSIPEALTAVGLSPTDAEQRCDVDQSILRLVDRGLIQLASIPQRFLTRLAAVLQVSREQLQAFLQQRPRFSPTMQWKSSQVPQLNEPISFQEAVRLSNMSEAQKRHWLAAE